MLSSRLVALSRCPDARSIISANATLTNGTAVLEISVQCGADTGADTGRTRDAFVRAETGVVIAGIHVVDSVVRPRDGKQII